MTCLKLKMPPISNPSGLPIAPNPGTEVIAITGSNTDANFLWPTPPTFGPGQCPSDYIELEDAIYEHHAYNSLAGMTATRFLGVMVNPWNIDFTLDRWYQWTTGSPSVPSGNPQDSTIYLSVDCFKDPPPPPPEEPGGIYCEPITLSPEIKLLQAKEVFVRDSCISPNITADKAVIIQGSLLNATVDAGDIFTVTDSAFIGNGKSKKIAYFESKLFFGSIETEGYAIVRTRLAKACKGKLGILAWPGEYYDTTFEGGSMYFVDSTFTACRFELSKPYQYLYKIEGYIDTIANPITIGVPNPYLPYSPGVYNALRTILGDIKLAKTTHFKTLAYKYLGGLVQRCKLWACNINGIEDAFFDNVQLIYTSFNFSILKIGGTVQHIGGNSSADYIRGGYILPGKEDAQFINGGGTVAVKHWRAPDQPGEWTYAQIADTAITNLGQECDIWCEGFDAKRGIVNYTAKLVHLVKHTIDIECNINIAGDATNSEAFLHGRSKKETPVVIGNNGLLDIKGDLELDNEAAKIKIFNNGKLSVKKINVPVSRIFSNVATIELLHNSQLAVSEIELLGDSEIIAYGESKLAGQITVASSRAGANQESQGGTNINFMFRGLLSSYGDAEIYIDTLTGLYRLSTGGRLLVIKEANPIYHPTLTINSTIGDTKAEIEGVFYRTFVTPGTLVTSNLQLYTQSALACNNIEGSNINFYDKSSNRSDLFEIPGTIFYGRSVNTNDGMVKNSVFNDSINYGIADSCTFTNKSEVGGTIYNNATIEDNCIAATQILGMIADGKCELNIKNSNLAYNQIFSGGMYGFDPETGDPREYVRATSEDKAIAAYGKPYIRVVGPSVTPIDYDTIKLTDSTIMGVTTQKVEGSNSQVINCTDLSSTVNLRGGLSQLISCITGGKITIESSELGAHISNSTCDYNTVTIKGNASASSTVFHSQCIFESLGSWRRLAIVEIPVVQPDWMPPKFDSLAFFVYGYSSASIAEAALRIKYPTASRISVDQNIQYDIHSCDFGWRLPYVPATKENHKISKCSIQDSYFGSCNVTFTDCLIDRCVFFNGDFKFIDCTIRN